LTRLALLSGVLVVPTLPVGLYLLNTLAACELSLFLVMLANGQPNSLGFPSTVKSCSNGDSAMEGIKELDPAFSG
jgi:hypothetical protein